MLKPQFVNLVSGIYGDGSNVIVCGNNPTSLKVLVTKYIEGWTTDALNVAYAQATFHEAFLDLDKSIF